MYREFCSEDNAFGARPYWVLCLVFGLILFIDVFPAYLFFNDMPDCLSMMMRQKELYALNYSDIIDFPNIAMIIFLFNYMIYVLFINMFFGYVYSYKLALRPLYKYPFKLACARTGLAFDVALPALPEIQGLIIGGKFIPHYFVPPPSGSPLEKCRKLATIYLFCFIFMYCMISISGFFVPDKVNFNITKYVIPKITNYKFCYAYAEKNYPDKINFKMVFAKDYDKCLLPDVEFQSQTFYSADNIKDFKKDSPSIFWTILKFSIAPLLTFFLALGKNFLKKE